MSVCSDGAAVLFCCTPAHVVGCSEQLGKVVQCCGRNVAGEIVSKLAPECPGQLLRGLGDEEPIDVVRVLVHESVRCRLSFTQLVQLRHHQCRRAGNARVDGAVVVGVERSNGHHRVIDDGRLEPHRPAERPLAVRRSLHAAAAPSRQRIGDH
jgi:hypothetical protein